MKGVYFILVCLLMAAGTSLMAQQSTAARTKMLQQVQLLLNEKSLRTPAQRKMDSHLLQAMRESSGQQMVSGVNLAPMRLRAGNSNLVAVDIHADVTDALIVRIEALGGKIIYPSWEDHMIRADIPIAKAETVAGFPEVKFIGPAVEYTTGHIVAEATRQQNDRLLDDLGAGLSNLAVPAAARQERVRKEIQQYVDAKYPSPFFSGSVNGEGDRVHRADETRNKFGYLGQGIKIGVLSDSYNKLAVASADVSSGNLPGTGNPYGNTIPVTVIQDNSASNANDEGRAMLQIVHDLAPKAQLYFATGSNSDANFAANIRTLYDTYHCDVIIDDLRYYNESPFQDGLIAKAVNYVTGKGVLYFSSCGNYGSVLKGTAGYFEGDFNDNGSPVFSFPGGTKTGTIHNFGGGQNGNIVLSAGAMYTLKWADPLGSSSNDYDLFLVKSDGTVIGSSTNVQGGSSDPYENITPPTLNVGDRLVVFKTAAAQVRAFALGTLGGTLTSFTTGEVNGHSVAADAFDIAATPAYSNFSTGYPTGPYPAAFSTASTVEKFSSDGPRRMFYDENGTPYGSSFTFAGGSVSRAKPDFTAADGVATTLALGGLNPFFGTSAAAPHAGAIAALLRSAKPSLTIAEVKSIFTNTALDIEGAGTDINSGVGIIQAYQAMQAVNPTSIPTISLGTVTVSEMPFSNTSGSVDPGEPGKIVVQLNNFSNATATNVTATLSTSYVGVTITQNSFSAGSIAAAGSATNNANPFVFTLPPSVPCGTVINFTLSVAFGGGGQTPQVFQIQVTAGKRTGVISASLGSPATGAGFTSTTGTQTGRLNRVTPISVCGTNKSNPGLATAVGARAYDAYTFTNNGSTQCVTVTLNALNGKTMYMAAYGNAGFVPATPNTNFLADQGVSSVTQSFSFNATAGQSFTIVVHEVTGGDAVGSAYTLDVSLTGCTVAPTCNTALSITTTSPLPNAVTGTAYNQPITVSGGSGAYTIGVFGSLPSGLAITNGAIVGTAVQGGSNAFTITASDPLGCTATNKQFAMDVYIPNSITASAGTPQTTASNTAFPIALQATVKTSSNQLIPNALVTFTTASTTATAYFPGNSNTATAYTNSSGVATAPTLTANANGGTFTATATVGGLNVPAVYTLTNSNCSVTCPSAVTVNSETGKCGATVTYPAATASCGGTLTYSAASGSFFAVGATTVNVSSSAGGSCSFIVTVLDKEAPVISCPSNITVNNTTNQCGAIVNFSLPAATDNCSSPVTVSTSPASGTFFAKGTTSVTVTATDAANNTSTCTFNVIVNDTQAPAFSSACPADITVNSAAGQCGAVVSFTAPAATDNCPGVTVTASTNSGSQFPVGVTTVIYTATDASGNKATCSFKVTVKDIEAPVITCPANMAVNTDAGKCGAVVNFTPIATDNCSGVTIVSSPASGSLFAKGNTTVTCTATDASGNTSVCTFVVTVTDKEAPVINCPADIKVNTDAGKCTAVVNFSPVATDNCPGTTIVSVPASGSVFPIGTTVVTSTATDAAGNKSSCTFKVIVSDGQPASITVQPVDRTLCINNNGTMTVTATGVTGYQWQLNTGSGFTNITGANGPSVALSNVTLAMSGYRYQVLVSGTCSSVTSNTTTLTVTPLPTIGLTAAPLSSLKPGQTTTITATTNPSAGGTFVWTRNGNTLPNANSRVLAGITVDGIGTYRVVYTNVCPVTSADLVIGATASDEVFMYPNPSTGRFQLRYYTPVNETLLVLINDMNGGRIFTRTLVTSGPYTAIDINLSTHKSGVYVIELRDKDNKQLSVKQLILAR